jgi:hypothetical protein
VRLLVCGSRNGWDAAGCWKVLDEIRPLPELVICGGASGYDSFAEEWAKRRGIACAVFKAPWDSPLGKSAGPVRNGWMLRYGQPDLVLAFEGGAGTANMIAQAKKAGVPVRKV